MRRKNLVFDLIQTCCESYSIQLSSFIVPLSSWLILYFCTLFIIAQRNWWWPWGRHWQSHLICTECIVKTTMSSWNSPNGPWNPLFLPTSDNFLWRLTWLSDLQDILPLWKWFLQPLLHWFARWCVDIMKLSYWLRLSPPRMLFTEKPIEKLCSPTCGH